MYLDAAKKQEIFGKYGKSNTDTGSAEAQMFRNSACVSNLLAVNLLKRRYFPMRIPPFYFYHSLPCTGVLKAYYNCTL